MHDPRKMSRGYLQESQYERLGRCDDVHDCDICRARDLDYTIGYLVYTVDGNPYCNAYLCERCAAECDDTRQTLPHRERRQ